MGGALATPEDVATVWRPIADDEFSQVVGLIAVASAKLRQACPFDLDARIASYAVTPGLATSLNPVIVANVVATIVKRVLVNPDGAASTTESVGPFSESRSFRSDDGDSGNQGAVVVTAADVAQLLPAAANRGLPRTVELSPSTRMASPVPETDGWRAGWPW